MKCFFFLCTMVLMAAECPATGINLQTAANVMGQQQLLGRSISCIRSREESDAEEAKQLFDELPFPPEIKPSESATQLLSRVHQDIEQMRLDQNSRNSLGMTFDEEKAYEVLSDLKTRLERGRFLSIHQTSDAFFYPPDAARQRFMSICKYGTVSFLHHREQGRSLHERNASRTISDASVEPVSEWERPGDRAQEIILKHLRELDRMDQLSDRLENLSHGNVLDALTKFPSLYNEVLRAMWNTHQVARDIERYKDILGRPYTYTPEGIEGGLLRLKFSAMTHTGYFHELDPFQRSLVRSVEDKLVQLPQSDFEFLRGKVSPYSHIRSIVGNADFKRQRPQDEREFQQLLNGVEAEMGGVGWALYEGSLKE